MAVIDPPHTFLEVTCLWEEVSSLMTGEAFRLIVFHHPSPPSPPSSPSPWDHEDNRTSCKTQVLVFEFGIYKR